jgi:hypothetical protein
MITATLLVSIIADSLALLILLYIVFALVKADEKYVKEHMLHYYELLKRDKVFRKSLFILAISLIFTVAATIWTVYSIEDITIINSLRAVSGVFRALFFIYLIGAVRSTMQ